jgi:FkbM family methyltransferase
MDSNNTPIVIISYNNYKYVNNMIKQLESLITVPNILIIDNNSNCKYTIDYINKSKNKYTVINCDKNFGHMVWKESFIFDILPDMFIITDPDLQFNKKTPTNFIDVMIEISNQYKSNKVGFALDISEPEKMFPYSFNDFGYHGIHTIWESQKQYWVNKIENSKFEMYFSPVDTTFCLFNKNYTEQDIRMAGDFTMKHLPWYIDVDDISKLSRYLMYNNTSSSSSISCFEMKYLADNKFVPITKRNETFLIQFDGGINDYFWENIYPNWENDTFDIFDKYLNKEKQFLDIGSWVGVTCLYASRLSSYVVCVEADPVSAKKLQHNINTNLLDTNIDIEHSAIYNESTNVVFGPNQFSSTSQLNDSMSQIKLSETNNSDVMIKTITLDEIIKKYNLNNLSLIKVDIEGGEEYILNDLLEYSNSNIVPIYISFHYDWWIDKNLDRFLHLQSHHKTQIISSPFCSILFTPLHTC